MKTGDRISAPQKNTQGRSSIRQLPEVVPVCVYVYSKLTCGTSVSVIPGYAGIYLLNWIPGLRPE